MNRKGIVVLLTVFFALMALDLYSTLRFGELIQYLEANPIYKYVGIPGIIALNLVMMGVVYLGYKNPKKVHRRFAIINSLVTICVIRVMVIINNWKIAQAMPTLEQAMTVTAQMKTQAIIQIASNAFIPFVIGYVSYMFFTIDHNIEAKDDS